MKFSFRRSASIPDPNVIATPPISAPSIGVPPAAPPSVAPPSVAAPSGMEAADVTPYLAPDGQTSAPSDAPQFAEPAPTASAPAQPQPQPQPPFWPPSSGSALQQAEQDALAQPPQINPDGSQTWSAQETFQGPGRGQISVSVSTTQINTTGQATSSGQPLTSEQQALLQQTLARVDAQRSASHIPVMQGLLGELESILIDKGASAQPVQGAPVATPGEQMPPQQ